MGGLTAAGLTILGCYLLGAIPFGYLVARWKGVDILHRGSGNIGATNVGRVLGRRYAILVFALDFGKGALAVAAATWVTGQFRPGSRAALEGAPLPVAAALAAFLGHLFPVYLRFRGGKGVATGAGAVAVLLPGPALAALLVWVMILSATRYVSLASLGSATALCVLRLVTSPAPWAASERVLSGFCVLAAMLVFVRHRTNIARLWHGKENRVRETPTMLNFTKVVHLLALGTWLGAVVFFTCVAGLGVFQAFQHLAEKDAAGRPPWFPLPAEYQRDVALWQTGSSSPGYFADAKALRREQGTRAAGYAVGAMFQGYFALQLICGLAGASTAVGWWADRRGRREAARATLLVAGLLAVLMGWALERHVARLQEQRDQQMDAALANPIPSPAGMHEATEAAHEFGKWHGISLLVNFATALLVGVAMAMAAWLPVSPPPAAGPPLAMTSKG